MPNVAIVYHSGYGHTKVLAEAVARGAASDKQLTDAFHAQRAQVLLRQMAWWGRALAEAREREPYPAR